MAGDRFRCFFDIAVGSQQVGRVIFEIRGDVCPITAENFRCLCTGEKGTTPDGVKLHYKGTRFHRVITDTMLIGGDITRGDGTGGTSIFGKPFEDENFILRHTGPGCLSMGNRGPDSNTSIFFICTVKTGWLDEKHVVFGYVADGMDVLMALDKIGSPSGAMKAEVTIADCGMLLNGAPARALPGATDSKTAESDTKTAH